ncbi:neprilysin-1 [Nephila pilipes]|uniref:Neprilysin-1 n=1 Tax=Nephila pilipes TaxID=299642 RepID=A0A8X6MSK2_NEPPI|nr:neprilysin-1 [Nephila pilipes]
MTSRLCAVCGKTYVNEGSLRKHIAVHPEASGMSTPLRRWPMFFESIISGNEREVAMTTKTATDVVAVAMRRETNTSRSFSCRPRTASERILLFLLLAVCTLCAILVILLCQQKSPPLLRVFDCIKDTESCQNTSCSHVCLTETCVQAAATLLKNMDPLVSPCEDFYQFACGKWAQHHELPSDRSYYDTFSLMKDELKAKLRELLEDPASEEDSNATISAKNLYVSCMNERAIEELKEQPLLNLLEELGGWPVISSNWSEESFDWVLQIARLRQYNNDILLGQWVAPDGKNSSLNIIQLDQADLGLPSKEYYIQGTQQLEAYGRFMVDIAQLLGATPEQAENDMREVLEFETILANFTIPSEERRNYTAIYLKMTLAELQEKIPLVNWTLYFSIAMPLELTDDEEVVVYAVPYLLSMSDLVTNTSKRTVANYILWRFVYNRVSNLDKRFLAKQQEYYSALYGTQAISPRWKTCTVYVNKNMGMAVGSLFVKRHFNEKSKETAEEMIKDIKTAFLELLDEVDWMDGETREAARQKAVLMSEKIGFPEYLMDPQTLDEEFEGIEFKPDTYFENVLLNLKHYSRKEQLKLRTPVDRMQWVTSPAVVNAFYTRSKNFITFPAGILQPPLYHQNYIRSLNYGGIGVVIGHEITHGFDDKGRQFDHFGNLKQWWHSDALQRFQTKADCMINQYGDYIMTDIDMKVNGINTQGENIADNGGVKQAFRAYRSWVTRNGEEPLLPGLNLTHEQLFFLNYAQIWCGVMRPEAAVNIIRTGAHSPGRFRVIGALSNSKDFIEAYNCPLGSPMNPEHKCEVW